MIYKHYIYVVHVRKFIRTKKKIYKIGRTTQSINKRFKQYPKGSKLLYYRECENSHATEKILINIFTEIFVLREDIGNEYFEGDCVMMVDCIEHFMDNYPIEAPTTLISRDTCNIIIPEDYKQKYTVGNYGDFQVIIMKDNGYINATKLCALAETFGGNSIEFKEWRRNSKAKDIMKAVAARLNNKKAEDLLIIVTDGPNDFRGTYAHPKLMPHIASWASPEFGADVSDIVNDFFIEEALKKTQFLPNEKEDKTDELIAEKYEILVKKYDKLKKKYLNLIN